MKLFPYQEATVEFCMNHRYSLMALEPGLGKSICAMETARRMKAKHILIVCPASIKIQWQRMIKEYLGLDSQVMTTGSDKPTENIVIVNYDLITTKRKDKYELFHKLAKRVWDCVIIDESHYLRTANSKRTRLILGPHSFLKHANRVLLLTGTPVINVPNNLYPILKTFIPERLGEYVNWIPFIIKFCGGHFRPFGWYADGASNLDILSDMLSDFMVRYTKQQVLTQLPPIIETVVPIAIKIAESEADTHIATLRKLIAEAKCEQIISIITNELETIDKLIVFFYHRNVGDILNQRLKEHNPIIIYGGISNANRSDSINLYFREASYRVALLQIQSASQGLDGFQAICHHCIFAEIDWSPGILQQAKDRLHRLGQNETVFIKYIIAQDTIDEHIYDLLGKKQSDITTIMKDNERIPAMSKEKLDTTIQSLSVFTENLNDLLTHLMIVSETITSSGVTKQKVKSTPAIQVIVPVPANTVHATTVNPPVILPPPAVVEVHAAPPTVHLTLEDISGAANILINDLNPTGTVEGKNAAVTWIKENIFIPKGAKMADIKPEDYEVVYESLLDPKTPSLFPAISTEEDL